MMRMLVSVRTVDEARTAATGGADFIDLKEPRAGALGGLPVACIRDIVAALRSPGEQLPRLPHLPHLPISATIGDLPMTDLPGILRQVDAVGACGVDYVKVGIDPVPAAVAVLQALAASRWAIVPVFIADRGLDFDLVGLARGFPAVMADTADKRAGSLFDVATATTLQRFVDRVRGSGALVGLAGALRVHHLQALADLAPDFAGFRSAVCEGDRGSALSPRLLREVAQVLRATGGTA
jgi:(5-formylfuran-3-yl)methyl phosphate synthase